MSLRRPITACLRASTGPSSSSPFTLPIRSFSASSFLQAKPAQRHRKGVSRDPYVVAQRNRKKQANLSRRAELEQARVASLGDPVRGQSTPFVESFATATSIEGENAYTDETERPSLNYAFSPGDVKVQLLRSAQLAVPLTEVGSEESDLAQMTTSETVKKQNEEHHARAAEAIARITAIGNGSSKDRMRVNIARCVNTFGRHETDKRFPPRAPGLPSLAAGATHPIRPETNIAATAKRVGPDTGSSEVQIAILTAKIKTLADFLMTRGKGDKHNKRNLRLLVHRRQKLLQYLRKKERGGPRWQHCIETLGLTEGTWRGEISL